MPRTFSLARLMLGITALCIIWGVLVNFPLQVLFGLIFVAQLLPTALVWFLFVRTSRHKTAVTVLVVIGGTIGLLFGAMSRSLNPISPATFALLFCGGMLAVKRYVEA